MQLSTQAGTWLQFALDIMAKIMKSNARFLTGLRLGEQHNAATTNDLVLSADGAIAAQKGCSEHHQFGLEQSPTHHS